LIYESEQRLGVRAFGKPADALLPNSDYVSTDLREFETAMAAGQYLVPARLLAKGFLSSLPEVPTDKYDRWVDTRNAALRAELRTHATRRWSHAEAQDLWDARAREAAQALFLLDPTSEEWLRRVMWAEAMDGAPLEAIATFEAYVEQQGVLEVASLDDATTRLLERVRSLAPQSSAARRAPARLKKADPSLVGRDRDIERLRRLVLDSTREELSVVAIDGDAGMGKTRLVAECLTAAVLQGRLVLWGTLAELEQDIALNALIDAMSTKEVGEALVSVREPWRSIVLSLIPELIGVAGPALSFPQVQATSLQRRLLESVRLLVQSLVNDYPVILVLDDFHWVDDSSLAALEYLRRRWVTGSLVLVVTHRPGMLHERPAVERFLSSENVARVALSGIDVEAARRLVREAATVDVPKAVVDGLIDLGGGNPLFLIELSRQWSDGKINIPILPADKVTLPVSIEQLFAQRVQAVPEGCLRILELLALFNKPVPMEALAEILELSFTSVANRLASMDRTGLVRWSPGGVELWHELIRQSLVSRAPESRVRWLHGRVADYLVGQGDDIEPAEVSLHYDRAHRRKDACRFGLLAANRAEEVGAVPEALLFLGVSERNASTGDRTAISMRLASLLHQQCAHARAADRFEMLISEQTALSEPQHLLVKARLFDCNARIDPENDGLLGALDGARRSARSCGAWGALAFVVRAGADYFARTNRVAEVGALLRDLENIPRDVDARTRCMVHQAGFLLRLFGVDVDAGRHHAEEALSLALTHDLSDLIGRSYLAQVTNLQLDGLGETERGRSLRQKALAAGARAGDLHSRFKLLANLSGFYLEVAEFDKAQRYVVEALGLIDSVDLGAGAVYLKLNEGELALERREPDVAERIVSGLLPTRDDQKWYGWAIVHAVLGMAALDTGKLGSAKQHAETLVSEWPERSTALLDVATASLFRARVEAIQGNTNAAIDILAQAESDLAGVNIPQELRVIEGRLRIQLRADPKSVEDVAAEAAERSVRLGLMARARTFERLLTRASGGI